MEPLPEKELERIERRRSADDVPMLVGIVRDQQREIDRLRSSIGVVQRDREELRQALLRRADDDAPPGAQSS